MSNTGRQSFLEVVSGNCKNDANDIDVIEILSCCNSLEIETTN
jgi:hypothetical protein